MYKKKLITVKEFAQEYGIGLNKAYEMCNYEDFPVIYVGRKKLILADKLDSYLELRIGHEF